MLADIPAQATQKVQPPKLNAPSETVVPESGESLPDQQLREFFRSDGLTRTGLSVPRVQISAAVQWAQITRCESETRIQPIGETYARRAFTYSSRKRSFR